MPANNVSALPGGLHNPTTSEPEYTDEEREFMLAMQAYKTTWKRPFPTWREVLVVVKSLGYRQVCSSTFKELLNGTSSNGRADAD